MNIRQAPVDAVVAESELGVVDAEEMQYCDVNVVDFGGLESIEWLVAPSITFTGDHTRSDAAAA